MTIPPTNPSPAGRRWLRRVLLTLVALEGLWLVLGNAFLATPLGPRLASAKRGKVQVEWSRGWTVLPGWLHVRDLKVRVRTLKTLWAFDIERASVLLSVPELALRRFHTLHADLDGARMRVAKRRAESTTLPPGIPQIDAFVSEPGPVRRLPIRHPWRLRFRNLEVDNLEELWFETVRYRTGEAGGTLNLDLDSLSRGTIELRTVELDLVPGLLDLVGEPAGVVASLELSGSLGEIVKSRAARGEWVDALDVDCRAEVDSMDLAALSWFLRSSPVSLGGSGRLEAEVSLRRGVVQPGSQLEVPEGQFDLVWLDTEATGKGALSARVDRPTSPSLGEPAMAMRLRLDEFALRQTGAEVPHIQGDDLRLLVETEALRLLPAQRPFGVGLVLRQAEVPDLAAYNAYLPPNVPLRLEGGRGTIDAELSFLAPVDAFSARIALTATDARGRFQDLEFGGVGHLDALLPIGDLRTHQLTLERADLRVEDVSIDGVVTGPIDGWWARGRLDEGLVDFAQPLSVEATAQGTLRDSSPLVALFAEKRKVIRWVDQLLTVPDVDFGAAVRLGGRADGGGLEIHDLEVGGGKTKRNGQRHVSLRAQVQLADHAHRGLYFLALGPLSAGVAMEPDGRDWKLTKSRAWYDRERDAFW